MKHVPQQKELILAAALERVDRATARVEPTLNYRRTEVLAANAPEALRYIAVVSKAVYPPRIPTDGGNTATETRENGDDEEIFRIIARYLSAPAQAKVIANRKITESRNLTSTRPERIDDHGESQALAEAPTIGELAWGAFSFGKGLCRRQMQAESNRDMLGQRKSRFRQLNLSDLSIIECAVSYQDCELDVGFMKHLSADGAEVIHSVAMVVACDFSQRIDTAIRTAAAVLIDPLVGGDADLCLCLLRSRRLPVHWSRKYGLQVDPLTR